MGISDHDLIAREILFSWYTLDLGSGGAFISSGRGSCSDFSLVLVDMDIEIPIVGVEAEHISTIPV